MADAFDVMEAGRMAVIGDPAGAVLSVWEAEPHRRRVRQHTGRAGLERPRNARSRDAARFYGELFGWRSREMPDSGGYRVIFNGERSNGGIFAAR